jgi:hypothetical protein
MRTAMQERRDEDRAHDFADSYYYRALRTGIGRALRTKFRVKEPLPDRIQKLLLELDEQSGGASSESKNEA